VFLCRVRVLKGAGAAGGQFLHLGGNIVGYSQFCNSVGNKIPYDFLSAMVLSIPTYRCPMSRRLIDEITFAGADWQLIVYGGAMHGFTREAAPGKQPGMAYHAASERGRGLQFRSSLMRSSQNDALVKIQLDQK